mmetsp:Transcript_15262/g.32406  ORF Transcript_15262/g.32406 Transcript_15262/m.32406 type:complete len:218 (+) Transcript_15262:252-905(+)
MQSIVLRGGEWSFERGRLVVVVIVVVVVVVPFPGNDGRRIRRNRNRRRESLRLSGFATVVLLRVEILVRDDVRRRRRRRQRWNLHLLDEGVGIVGNGRWSFRHRKWRQRRAGSRERHRRPDADTGVDRHRFGHWDRPRRRRGRGGVVRSEGTEASRGREEIQEGATEGETRGEEERKGTKGMFGWRRSRERREENEEGDKIEENEEEAKRGQGGSET